MRWAISVTSVEEKIKIPNFVEEKPEEKWTLGRSRPRRQDNVKRFLKQMEWDVVDCIHLAQIRENLPFHVNMIADFFIFFTVAPCILIFTHFIHQQMHVY
jgi:hypothetical protein